GKRPLILSRYAGLGSHRYPLGFSGDSFCTWKSLAFQPYFTATASNIGYGWWSHDIGGHMGGVRDDELTARWVQFGVFSPIFRLHSTSSLFASREPWAYNKRAELVMEDFMRLRHRLFPYLYTMNRRASEELIPLMRPMYHVHPESVQAYKTPNEYWFGTELIVAPITEPADKSDLARTQVWLPEGLWTDAFTGYVYHGNQAFFAHRPMETMPLFMKAGAIIPMQAHEEKSRRLGGAQQMDIYIAPGAGGSFSLYEDDGESLDYREGKFCVTDMQLEWKDTEAYFFVYPADGELALIPDKRTYSIHFRGFRPGCRFERGGKPVEARYDAQTATYTVELCDVETSFGGGVWIKHEQGLVSDNGDCRARIIDLLVRMQGTQPDKTRLLEYADKAMEMKRQGMRDLHDRLGVDQHRNMGGAILELINQLGK
ncbi:MAG: DUF5110 domain-containing protein, partial [Clostridia bacterium]|nr:DUF5110 domain-containing protein [Clostridia bacterium]